MIDITSDRVGKAIEPAKSVTSEGSAVWRGTSPVGDTFRLGHAQGRLPGGCADALQSNRGEIHVEESREPRVVVVIPSFVRSIVSDPENIRDFKQRSFVFAEHVSFHVAAEMFKDVC